MKLIKSKLPNQISVIIDDAPIKYDPSNNEIIETDEIDHAFYIHQDKRHKRSIHKYSNKLKGIKK